VGGTGSLNVASAAPGGGAGRIRVDTVDRRDLRLQFNPAPQSSVGANMFVFPDVLPRLDVIEVAGQTVAVGSDPVSFQLPFGSDPNQSVTVQAQDFNATVPVEVVLTPDSGPRVTVTADIANTTQNPATLAVPITMPVNTPVTIYVWKR